MNWAGFSIGKGTKVVGPLQIFGDVSIGENTWIGTGIIIHGNGLVAIGNNCDIAPNVTFLTGSHEIGEAQRRAGKGQQFRIVIKDGCWVGAGSTFIGDIEIGRGCVVGACVLVNRSWDQNLLIAGTPAKSIRELA